MPWSLLSNTSIYHKCSTVFQHISFQKLSQDQLQQLGQVLADDTMGSDGSFVSLLRN